VDQIRPRLDHRTDHERRQDPLADADEGVRADHGHQHCLDRHLGRSSHRELQDERGGSERHRQRCRDAGRCRDAAAAFAEEPPEHDKDEVSAAGADQAEVERVEAQSRQPAVGKEDGLGAENDCEDHYGRPRADEHRGENPALKVPALLAGLTHRDRHPGCAREAKSCGRGPRYEPVGNVHPEEGKRRERGSSADDLVHGDVDVDTGHARDARKAVRAVVSAGEAVDEIPAALFDRDGAPVHGDHRAAVGRIGERQGDARVPSQIPRLHPAFGGAEANDVTVGLHPHRRDMWGAVGIHRRDVDDEVLIEKGFDMLGKGGHLFSPGWGRRG
jgi:hypothetical protein